MATLLAVLVPLLLAVAIAQGRFRGNQENVLQHGEPNVGSRIATDRSTAALSCESGDMVVKINFTTPFRGVIYAQSGRLGPCRVYGDSGWYYELRIPLKGCGTWQPSPRVFSNNVTIRFHPSLELEEDETKTVICRYPPPVAFPPIRVVAPITSAPTTAAPVVGTAGLGEVEILLIICALLFLSLLTLGLGVAYFCLKKRNIHLVKRRKVMSSGPPSDVTKLSATTLSRLSLLDPIRIPRAVATSASGSEGALLASRASQPDSMSSDYPSESGSSGTEGAGRSSATRGQDNVAFTGDGYAEVSDILPTMTPDVHSYEYLSQRFPTRMTIPRARAFEDQTVTTVLGPEELIHWRSWNRNYAIVRPDSTPSTGQQDAGVPVYATVRKPRRSPPVVSGSEDLSRFAQPPLIPSRDGDGMAQTPRLQVATITDYFINTETVTEVQDTTTTRTETEFTPAVPEKWSDSETTAVKEVEAAAEVQEQTPLVSVRTTDELFVTNTTHTETKESVSKDTQDSFFQRPHSPPEFDVVIRPRPVEAVNKSLTVLPETIPEEPEMPETSPLEWNVIIRSRPPLTIEENHQEKTTIEANDETNSSEDLANLEEGSGDSLEDQSQVQNIIQLTETSNIPSEAVEKKTAGDEDLLLFSDSSPPSGRASFSESSVTEDVHSAHLSLLSEDSDVSNDSNGERSTSEVMEFIPTFARSDDPPALERSTSEIVTLPEIRRLSSTEADQGRALKPVLERYPASFIESIPLGMFPPGESWDRSLQPPVGVASSRDSTEKIGSSTETKITDWRHDQ